MIMSHVRGFEHHFTRQQEQFGDLQEMFWHVTRNASKWLRIWSIDGGSLSLFLEFGEFLQIQQNNFFQITIHIQDTGLQSRDDSQNHTDAAFCWVPKMNRPFLWSYRDVFLLDSLRISNLQTYCSIEEKPLPTGERSPIFSLINILLRIQNNSF